MYKRYMLMLCCFMPTLFAADKQEPKNRVIEALDLQSYQSANQYDAFHPSHLVKELARAYRELKGKYEQEEQKM